MNWHLCKLLFRRRRFASPITTARWLPLFFFLDDSKSPYLTHYLRFSVPSGEKMFCFCSKPDLSLSQLPSSGDCVKCPLHSYHSSFYPPGSRKVISGKAPGIWHAPFAVFNETAFLSSSKPSLSKRESDLTTVVALLLWQINKDGERGSEDEPGWLINLWKMS